MKSKLDIELALSMLEATDDHPDLRWDELVTHKALIDFARWVLDKPNGFGSNVFDPTVKSKDSEDNTFTE